MSSGGGGISLPANDSSPLAHGWISSPNQRGTEDILVSCLLTVVLCCWTSVYPNIPAVNESEWHQMYDKFSLAALAILGPEFLLGIAAGQMSEAAASVRAFREAGFEGWTLTHGFYADMGGFTLKVECRGKEVMFPVNARQVLFLVENGYLEFPRIGKNEIKDKNKANGLARFLTIIQAVWFLVNTIVRVSEGLAITTFELSTLSFIVVMFATSFCWFHKPSDVATSTVLSCPFSIEEILSKAGKANTTWMQTPLDFISRREHSLSKLWAYYMALGKKMHITIFSRPMTSTPRNRIPSDTWLKADLRYEVFWFTFILGFAATLMAGWNLHFPTSTEKVLWRVSTGYNLFYSFFGSVLIYFMEYILPRWQKDRRGASVESGASAPDARRSFTARLRNISSPYDPEVEISLGLLIPASLLCIGYMVCRMYIFVEEFAGLRQLPASVFDTVEWSNYVPHL